MRAAKELRRVARDTAVESAMFQVPRTTSSMVWNVVTAIPTALPEGPAPDPWHMELSWMRRRALEHADLVVRLADGQIEEGSPGGARKKALGRR